MAEVTFDTIEVVRETDWNATDSWVGNVSFSLRGFPTSHHFDFEGDAGYSFSPVGGAGSGRVGGKDEGISYGFPVDGLRERDDPSHGGLPHRPRGSCSDPGPTP